MSLPLSPVISRDCPTRVPLSARRMGGVTPARIGILALAAVVGSVLLAAARSGPRFDQPPEAS
jgi:hypothetical protein